MGAVLQGRYLLLEMIGDGGMGAVFRGERIGFGRPVAVKFLHAAVARNPQLAVRFQVEARAMGRLSHPNCISVIDFGIEGPLPYLVMELVEGTPLRGLLEQGRLEPRRAINIARQVLAGLEHAHEQQIIHRDVKPENILIEQKAGLEDHVRLVDFGLAKLLDESQLTRGMCLGTPHYMAPEQMDETPVDRRVDLYTTGIVLYEMLTGKKPFDGPDLGAVFLQQKVMAPPAFRAVAPEVYPSPALEAIVRRALEKAPAARFSSAMAMLEALSGVPELSSAHPPPAPPGPAPDATVFDALPFGAEAQQPLATSGPAPLGQRIRAALRRVHGKALEWWPAALVVVRRAGGALRRAATAALRRPSRRATAAAATVVLVVVATLAVGVLTRPRATGGTAAAATGSTEAAAPGDELAAIDQLVARGERQQAIARLREARRTHPGDPRYAAALATLCFQERRYSAAAAAYRAAIRADPRLREDPGLIGHLIDSLRSDAFAPTAEQLLRNLGRSARPQLGEAARSHANARVRARARELLREGRGNGLFRRR